MLNQAHNSQKKDFRVSPALTPQVRNPSSEIIKILIIEDDPQDVDQLLKLISQEKNFLCQIDCVKTLSEGLERVIAHSPHVILADLFLQDSQGLNTVTRLQAQASHVAIVVLAQRHEELGVEAVRRGAQDYLLKNQVDGKLLIRAIHYAIERKRIEEELTRIKTKFQAIFTALPDILFVLGNDGTILEYDTSASENLYISPDQFLSKKMQNVLPADIGEKFLTGIAECLKVKSVVSIEYALPMPTGEKNFECRMLPFSKDRIIAIVRDITGRKKVERELCYRVEFEKIITDISSQFINLSPQKIDESINQALKYVGEFAGVDRSYVFSYSQDGKTFSNTHEWCTPGIIPQIDRLQNLPIDTFPWFNAVLKEKGVFYAPSVEDLPPVAAAEKKEFQAESVQSLICVPIILEDSLVGFLGFDSVKTKKTWAEDIITLLKIIGQIFVSALERKRADEALRAEETKLKQIINLTPNFLYAKDVDGRFIIMNQAMADFCKVPIDQAIGKKDSDVVKDKKELERIRQDDAEVFKTGQKKFFPERTVTDPAGKTIVLQMTKIPFKIPGTETLALLGVSVDITERKKAEEVIKASEERYRRLLQSATDYIYTVTVKNGKPVSTFHGPGSVNVTGYTNQDYENDHNLWYRMIYEDDRKNVIEQAALALKGTSAAPIEHRIIHKDGIIRWISNALVVRKDEEGRLTGYDGLITDITARRHAEEKLRESEAKYRLLFDHVPAGVCHVDLSGKFIYVNDVLCRMLETKPEGMLQKTFKDFLHPDQVVRVWTLFQDAIRTGKPSLPYHETKCVTAGGKVIDIVMSNTTIEENGRFIGFQAMIQDVTERRKIEGVMREQSTAMKAAMDGMAIHNNKVEFVYLNEAHARIYGYDSPSELIGKSWKTLYEPKEIERFEKEVFPTFQKEGKWRGEAVGKRKDGSLFPQEISLTVIEGGGLVCVVRDITDRKKAEEALYYRIEFEKIIDTISTQFINLTPDKIDEGINQALKIIAEFAQVDRGFAFLYSERTGRVKHIYEWCVPGIPSQAHRLENAAASDFPWFEKQLRENGLACISRVKDMPSEARAEKEEFEAQKIQSLVSVPMIYEGSYIGFVGFDCVRKEKEWSEDIIALLRIIGEIFVNALQRKASEEQLIKLNRCFLDFGPDPIRNINQLVALCGELLGADCALYSRVNSGLLYVIGKWNTPPDIDAINETSGHICCDLVIQQHEEIKIIRNLLETPYAPDGSLMRRENIKTYVGQTVKFGSAFVGVICALYKNDFIPTEADKRLMSVIASAIGIEEERQRMEEALRKNETLVRTVFDTIPHWVFVKDVQSRFLLVNKKMAFDHGVAPSEMINLPTEKSPLGTDEEKAFFIGVDQQVFSTGELVEILDEKITRPNGESRHYHIIKVPLKNPSGNIIGLVAVGQDITERKKSQEELDEYRKHLEELVEERTRELRHSERLAATGRLAASIAHEINNPLQGITTHLEIMHEHFPSDFEKLKNYEFVKSNIEKIRGIVAKLLDTYRGTDEGKTDININDVVDKVASLIEHQLNLKNINLKLNLAKNLPFIQGWKQQLHQVLLNLVLNAQDSIKASKGTITISTFVGDGLVSTAITDTGEGIKARDMDSLFEPFFTTKESGTGLGLFVSQGIIKEHQGLIKVKSESGKGSTFTVTLPVAGDNKKSG